MPQDYDPAREIFDPKDCAKPMLAAVEQLAVDSSKSMAELVGLSYADIAQLANETYDQLPEFWHVWKGWHDPQPKPEMGDL